MKNLLLSALSVLSIVMVSCQSSDDGTIGPPPIPPVPISENRATLRITPTNMRNDISSKPFGINMNTLTDDQNNRAAGSTPLAGAIASIGVKYLRFPGGEKSDVYRWASPPYTDPTTSSLSRISSSDFPAGFPQFWNLTQNTWNNDNYDFDEFMTDCIAVDGEPVIVVALDGIYKPAFEGGTSLTRAEALEMARKWVEYANITRGYNVKYWSLGNETWNSDSYAGANPGFTQYGIDVALFAEAMKDVDPSIKVGINGNNVREFTDALAQCANWVDFLDIHTYPCFGFTEYADYEAKDLEFNVIIDAAQTAINSLPATERDRMFIAMTEISGYGYQEGLWDAGANLGQSLANFELLATLAADARIAFTQFWNTRWINNDLSVPQPTDVFTKTNMLNANGQVLALLHNNVHDQMVSATSTDKIKTFASLDSTTGELVVFLVNKSQAEQPVEVLLEDYQAGNEVLQSVYSGLNTQDIAPTLEELPSLEASENRIALSLKSTSITVLKLQTR